MELQENKRQEDKQKEVYEVVEIESVKEIEGRVKEQFGGKAWLYAVLDYAVGFGIYENDGFVIGLGNCEKPVPLEWEYLQELRIFNGTGELRLAPIKGKWAGRYRGSNTLIEENVINSNEYWLDERQKIWGEVKSKKTVGDTYWSLLTAERGTRIWIPVNIEMQGKAAICVRKFMRIPTAEDKELVYQTDIRMVEFCLWNEDNGKGER